MEDVFIDKIVALYKANKWEEILEITEETTATFGTSLLWVWPSKQNLKFIEKLIRNNGLKGTISIGCGTGLFEWLLQQCSNLPTIGIEVNKEWWTSKYSKPNFIKLQYPNLPPQTMDLNNNYALLFCYFNNGAAFEEYVNAYKGKLIFIIGPGTGRGTHTDPEPFKPNFKESNWKLLDYQEVRDTKDFIAAYIRL